MAISLLSPRAVQKNIRGLNFPSVVGKLKRLGGKPWCCLGTIAKRLIVSPWSQETWLLLMTGKGTSSLSRGSHSSARLALSCCDNRITSLTSRQHPQTAASSYQPHLSVRPCVNPRRLRLRWRSRVQSWRDLRREGEGMGDLLRGLLLESLTGPCSQQDQVRGLGWGVSHCTPIIPAASRANTSRSQAPTCAP